MTEKHKTTDDSSVSRLYLRSYLLLLKDRVGCCGEKLATEHMKLSNITEIKGLCSGTCEAPLLFTPHFLQLAY